MHCSGEGRLSAATLENRLLGLEKVTRWGCNKQVHGQEPEFDSWDPHGGRRNHHRKLPSDLHTGTVAHKPKPKKKKGDTELLQISASLGFNQDN